MILTWFTSLWGRLAAAGAVVLGILASLALVFRKGEQAGKAKIEAEQARLRDKAIAERKHSDEVVDNLSDDAVRERLRKQWGKD